MTILEIVFLVLLIFSLALFSISAFYLFRFSVLILNVQDSLEECIENLDVRQKSIAKILEIPLFFDSPEIRRVLEEVKESKDAIVKVAQVLGKVEEIEESDLER
jgi:hypothetical protein